MKVFLIDSYDSFVHIIDQYLKIIGLETKIIRNDSKNLISQIEDYNPNFLILGPGPGHPKNCGYLEIIDFFKGKIPILGVCLGHQAIGMAFGYEIKCAKNIMHGKVSIIKNNGKGIFSYTKGEDILATRYHSLIIGQKDENSELEIDARSKDDNYIMGISHKKYPIYGVQFHPESILTKTGIDLLKNFVDI